MRKFPFACWILLVLVLLFSPVAAAHYAYIANQNDNNVSVIDLASYQIVRNISVGTQPYGVAIHPAATEVYVTNRGSNTVSVIDPATHTVTATIAVGNGPRGITVNPAGTTLYVTNYLANSVSVVDIGSRSVTNTIAGTGVNPLGVGVSPNGTLVYVASRWGKFTVIDATTNTILRSYAIGGNGFGLAVNASGLGVYVASIYANRLSIIDGMSGTFSHNISVQSYPVDVVVDPQDTRVYVANFNGYSVSVIDQATGSVITTVNAGKEPQGISINGSGTRLLVTNSAHNNVTVIDTMTSTVVTNISVGRAPISLGRFILPELADLGLSMAASPDPVTPGGTLTCTLTAGTAGPDSGMNVWVNGTLPDGATFVSATPSQGTCTQSGSFVNCSLGTVTFPGAVPISLALTAPATPGTITSTARIASATYDPSTANATASISTAVQAPAGSPQTGSSGGSSTTYATAASTVSRLAAGEEVRFPFRNRDMPVRAVTFTTVTETGQVLITAIERSLPAGTPPPEIPVYQYVDLQTYHLPIDAVTDAAIVFQVPRSWVTAQKADPSQIVLLRYHADAWEELLTEFVEVEDGMFRYRSPTPGFSLFAIGVNLSREAPETPEPVTIATTFLPETFQEPLSPSVSPPPITTQIPLGTMMSTSVPYGSESSAPIAPALPPLIGIAAVVVLAAGILIWRRTRITTIRRKR